MFKFLKKIKRSDGFTLTEVMIGMSILTVAIVSSTNLVMGLMQANSNNVKTLQAYYLAQEGIELVRNVRDTNWLHNGGWLERLESGDFTISRKIGISGIIDGYISLSQFESYIPWEIDASDFIELDGIEFIRTMTIKNSPTECEGVSAAECNYKLVTAEITWKDGSKDREFTLDTILTNWKNGVF